MACNPCETLPRRRSCCDCIWLTKIGCIPHCGITRQMIPLPQFYVCGRWQGAQTTALCRRCCDGDGCSTDKDDPPAFGSEDCCSQGQFQNSCQDPTATPAKNDIWCHMRCSCSPSSLCRRCCDDGQCQPEEPAKCCQSIHQRMNF